MSLNQRSVSAGKTARKDAAGTARTARGNHETRIEQSLNDAEKVQDAAMRHAGELGKVGVSTGEIQAHAMVTGSVALALELRDEQSVDANAEAGRRDASLQAATDKLADLKRRAYLAFAAGLKVSEVDHKAKRAFGVGVELPRTVAAFRRPLQRIDRAMKNPAWKKAIGRRGIGAPEIKALHEAVTLAEHASERHVGARTGKLALSGTLLADVAEMRRLTTYLRTAGNAAFHGRPERAEFDPPARPRARAAAPPKPPAP